MGTPEEKEIQKGTQEILETTMTQNLPKLVSDTKPQIQEAQRPPSRIYVPKATHRHRIFKLQEIKG